MKGALALTVLLAGCPSKDPNEFIAGAWAVRGNVTYHDAKSGEEGRLVRAGHALRRGGEISLDDAEIAVEGFNGFIALLKGSRSKKIGNLPRIDGPLPPERVILLLKGTIDTKHVPPFPVANRYELPPDAKPVELSGDPEMSQNMAYFFGVHGKSDDNQANEPPPIPAGLEHIRIEHVHPIRVDPPKPTPDAPRALVSTSGPVVVELTDMTSAFAEDLKLPLDLDRVHRIAVLERGRAELRVQGQAVSLKEDDDLIVAQ